MSEGESAPKYRSRSSAERSEPSDRRSGGSNGRGGRRGHDRQPVNQAQHRKRLGQLLLDRGYIDQSQLDEALEEHRRNETRLGFHLVSLGYVNEEELGEVLELQYDIPAVELGEISVEEDLLDLVPSEFASKNLVLPIERNGRTLTVAMATPNDLSLIDDLRFRTGLEVKPKVASAYALRHAIEKQYLGLNERFSGILEELEREEVEVLEEEEEEDLTAGEVQAQVEEAPVVRLINGIMTDAVRREASDIHIEPYEDSLRVRYRVDGVLQDIMSPPKRLKSALISRIKILADLDIAERRIPQDGRIKMKMGNRVIDFRVSTLPVTAGEKIVLRVLDKSNLRLSLEDFGMEPKAEKDFLNAVHNPYGMILVTGPTGSGKTTTLYSALDRLNTSQVNIMTAEDPVEYNLAGINQVQIKPNVGLDFAAALKSFLRQDPDIVMVGEIRDLETGGIAIKAALTGHLVLSTLHTNDAASTVTRMVDMGLEPFNLASAVQVITAQRLVRRICDECRVETSYSESELQAAGFDAEKVRDVSFYEGEGCQACDDTGYSGRQGLYEVMPVSGKIRKMILDGASADELKRQAIENGMITLRQDGLIKVRRGITTLEEVLRETAV